jgi:hypothetical protein
VGTLAVATATAFMIALNIPTPQAQSGAPLVRATDLTHLGEFKVPTGAAFDYGGSALTFDPERNGLFLAGDDNKFGEISIPAIGGRASMLQSAVTLGGNVGGADNRIGGSLVYNGRLFYTMFIYYDADNIQRTSHFVRSTTLNSGSYTGPTRVGSLDAGFYSGYMGTIPPEWQSALGGPALTGNCCLSIISRTSYGPAVSSFNPDAMGNATALIGYPHDHTTLGDYGVSGSHPVFNGTTRIGGVVFPEGTRSVLFFGVTGTGNWCYGESSACGDPQSDFKGDHAYPYRGYVWAYDANDLAAVKAGSKKMWDVVPYATWELPLGNVTTWGIAGAAYDKATKRIYLVEKRGEGSLPVIQVFSVNVGSSSPTPTLPRAPFNVRVIK